MSNDCRFCDVAINPKCPKMNGLSQQLLEYHYIEEFNFFFARPINDMISDCRSREKIAFQEMKQLIRRKRLPIINMKTSSARNMLKELAGDNKKRMLPAIANHECWDKLKLGIRNRERQTVIDPSRRKGMRGKFPLREGSKMGKLLEGTVNMFVIPGSFCTKIHNIYTPEFSSLEEVKQEPTIRQREDRPSVFLDRVYQKYPKTCKIPLLDIRRIVGEQKASRMISSIQNQSTQFSLERSGIPRNTELKKAIKMISERSKSRKEPFVKSPQKSKSKIDFKLDLKQFSKDERSKKGATMKSASYVGGWDQYFSATSRLLSTRNKSGHKKAVKTSRFIKEPYSSLRRSTAENTTKKLVSSVQKPNLNSKRPSNFDFNMILSPKASIGHHFSTLKTAKSARDKTSFYKSQSKGKKKTAELLKLSLSHTNRDYSKNKTARQKSARSGSITKASFAVTAKKPDSITKTKAKSKSRDKTKVKTKPEQIKPINLNINRRKTSRSTNLSKYLTIFTST